MDLLGQDGDIISDTRNSRVFTGSPRKTRLFLATSSLTPGTVVSFWETQ